jgi:hypothetical protein
MTPSPKYTFTDTPWSLHRFQDGQRYFCGEFAGKPDAERAAIQLKKLCPLSRFQVTFTGKPISHHSE